MSVHKELKKITTHSLQEMKKNGEKIAMLTAYDYTMAKIIDNAGIDVIFNICLGDFILAKDD